MKDKKTPTTATAIHHSKKKKIHSHAMTTSIALQQSQKIISTFHTLKKQLQQVDKESHTSAQEKQIKKNKIEKQIQELGGLQGYQQASIFNESNYGDTSKWIIKELKQIFTFEKRIEMKRKITLLDVGALKHHYHQYDYIDCTAIDIQSQDAQVQQIDFFDYFAQHSEKQFDVIVLSLVVNFVDDPKKRGQMLQIASQHCQYLYFIVPRACIDNSRYFDMESFTQLMQQLNMTVHTHTFSEKLFFALLVKSSSSATTTTIVTKRQMKRFGSTFNNFTILL